ncbi:hypothetical protein [Bradyrhizobium sp. SZCCHNS3002]|uniref:hypothetical protein n=1 Tax=Bradyrhizobium sp. SZCCHNS3002 TaxID=3057310 RepID=UPI0028E3CC7E|nr:hypothetical protein [Bradyrhizobium sp. SZCCHNS3002]
MTKFFNASPPGILVPIGGSGPSKTAKIFVAKLCRHLYFGLTSSAELQRGVFTPAEMPASAPEEFKLPYDLINEAVSRRVFWPPPPTQFGLTACAAPANAPPPMTADCQAALASVDRATLLNLPYFAALEVLDNYLGSANYSDPKTIAQLRLALVAVKSKQPGTLAPADLVEYLGLKDRVGKPPAPTRVQDFPSFMISAPNSQTFSVTTPTIFAMKLSATMRLSIDTKKNEAWVQAISGRVYWSPPSPLPISMLNLNQVSANWCRANPAGIFEPSGIFPAGLLTGLDEQISSQRQVSLTGMFAAMPLPFNDPALEHNWLCLSMTGINNGTTTFSWAHAPDAFQKGCKNCQ